MDFEIEEEALSIYYFICSCNNIIKKLKTKERKKKSIWVKGWPLEKNTKGTHNSILNELKLIDFKHFCRYLPINRHLRLSCL